MNRHLNQYRQQHHEHDDRHDDSSGVHQRWFLNRRRLGPVLRQFFIGPAIKDRHGRLCCHRRHAVSKCAQIIWRQRSLGSRRHCLALYFRLRLGFGFMRRLDPVPPYGSHFLVTVRGTRRGIPAATLAMPIQIRGAIGLAGFRFGHAVFRCMGDGWPQQHHNSNGDSTHVLNTHDREPYQFTGQTERRAKLGQRDIACALRTGNLIPAWVGHNETCALSLMSGIWVNSGTVPRRAFVSALIRDRSLTVVRGPSSAADPTGRE